MSPRPRPRGPLTLARMALLRRTGWTERRVHTSVGEMSAWEVAGGGPLPDLLMVHGMGACAADYAPLVARMRPHFRRILLTDNPGHGMSPIPVGGMDPDSFGDGMWEMLEQIIDHPVILLGNSLGGYVAARFASEHPDLLRALLLISPGGGPLDDADWAQLQRFFDLSDPRHAWHFADQFLGAGRWARLPVALMFRRRLARSPVQDLLQATTSDRLLSAQELARIAVPTLLFWGLEDQVLPGHHPAFFAEHLPDVTVRRLPGFGHAPFFDRPAAFADEVLDFVRGVVPA